MGAASYTVSRRVEGENALIEATGHTVACGPSRPIEPIVMVTIPLPATPTACPVGELALQHKGEAGTTVQLATFIGSLDERARTESMRQLASYASRRNREEADAFVVSCAPLRFVFVDGGRSQTEPRWEGWTYEPAAPEDTSIATAPPPSSPSSPPPTIPSPHGCRVPPLPKGATRWIGRSLLTGIMPGPSRLTTVVVDDAGGRQDQVQITTFSELATKPTNTGAPVEVPPTNWSCGESSVIEGTIRRQRGGFTIELAGTEPLTCKQRRVSVAAPATLRLELPQLDESCKRSKWAKTGPQREVMECEGAFRAILSRGAGVEHVTIDEDDCGDPTKALREIAADGAVRVVRRYPPRK